MHKILCQILLIVVTTFSSANFDNSYQIDCEFRQDTVCTHDNVESVIKDGTSEFKVCPNTSHICMEKNSRIYLNNSRLFLFDSGALNVLEGGVIRITRNGICKIFGRAFVEIEKNATATIDNGRLTLSVRGEIYNKGVIYIGEESSLHVTSHAQIVVGKSYDGLAGGTLQIGKASTCEFAMHSHATISAGSELRTTEGNRIRVTYHGLLEQQNATILIDSDSELEIYSFSSLKVGYSLCSKNANKTSFIFGVGSKLWLKGNSNINVQSGQLILDDNTILWVHYESEIYVQGLLQIKNTGSYMTNVQISSGKKIIVGQMSTTVHGTFDENYCGTNASLIISKEDVLPKNLVVKQGAHCFTKPTGEYSKEFSEKADVELEASSDTNEFKCFATRNELMKAVKVF